MTIAAARVIAGTPLTINGAAQLVKAVGTNFQAGLIVEVTGPSGQRTEISGANRSFYCGASWRYGFHEDGAISGEWVAEDVARVVGPRGSATEIRAAG